MPEGKRDAINKYAIAHLQDCLKLQNNTACLNAIIDNILEVGRRHLPPVMLASHRKKAKLAIGEELKELYPDIFGDEDSEKRVYIAVQIAIRQHGLLKQDSKKTKNKARQLSHQKKAGTPTSKSVSKKPHTGHSPPLNQNQDFTTDKASQKMKAERVSGPQRPSPIPMCNREEDQVPINLTEHASDSVPSRRKAEMPLSERMALNLASVANTPPTPDMFASQSISAHTSHSSSGVLPPFSQPKRRVLFVPHVAKSQPQVNNTSKPCRTTDDSCSKYSSVSTMPVTYSPSANTSNLSPSTGRPTHESLVSQNNKKSVLHFLETSVPSMSHLLPRFIDYGCTHEGFLLAVSMWPPERISKFLEDVVTGSDGQLPSPMDKMVLEFYFRQYFKLDA